MSDDPEVDEDMIEIMAMSDEEVRAELHSLGYTDEYLKDFVRRIEVTVAVAHAVHETGACSSKGGTS